VNIGSDVANTTKDIDHHCEFFNVYSDIDFIPSGNIQSINESITPVWYKLLTWGRIFILPRGDLWINVIRGDGVGWDVAGRGRAGKDGAGLDWMRFDRTGYGGA
jgi:hypothetical protein